MQKEIYINGTDRSSLFAKYGYTIQYKKINGSNGGTMLDGSTTVDIIAIKAVLTLPLMPLAEAQMNELISDIYSDDYVTVRFYDVRQNEYREAEFIYTEVTPQHLFQNVASNEMWRFNSLKLTER